MSRKASGHDRNIEDAHLPDELDNALEALWRGESGKFDQLIETVDRGNSTIGRMVRAAVTLMGETERTAIPQDIDDFSIEGEIGRGGMGVVYRARQKHPDRTVAIKLIQPGKLTPEYRRRFRYEADVLASLTHPGIASIHQVGLHSVNGKALPYIVMEFVNGEPLTQFCKSQRLGVKERIALFLKVCDAVQYAHQRGILHRDIKPDNILLALDKVQGEPIVKLLDFGVARPLVQQGDSDHPRTTDGSFVGTMLYMSPEQVTGEAVDVRSDVYSLGVLLYEMLLDRLPYEAKSGVPSSVIDAIRTQPPQFDGNALLDRDLRAILNTALAKDRAQRYPSAEALNADLRRYLRHEPISARSPSPAYQLAKFARRSPLVVGGASAFVLLLVTAVIVISILLVQMHTARDAEAIQRHLAEREAAKQQAVVQFLHDTLGAANPRVVTGAADVTVREMISHAATVLDAGRAGYEPEVEASVRDTIGHVYLSLGMYHEAERMHLTARALRADHLDPHDPGHAESKHHLGAVAIRLGDMDRAEKLLERALALRKLHHGELSIEVANTMDHLSTVMTSRRAFQEAHSLQSQVLDIRRNILLPNDPLIGQAVHRLGTTYLHLGQYSQCREHLEEALAIREQALGAAHPDVAETLADLAFLYRSRGQHDQAEEAARRCIDIRMESYGQDHPLVASALHVLASIEFDTGQHEEALMNLREALRIRKHVHGSVHPTVMLLQHDIDLVLAEIRQFDEAKH